MQLTQNAIKVLEKRYLAKDENGNPIETIDEMFRRVARHISKADKNYDPNSNVKETEEEFYNMMTNLEFMPNSPTLMNAGRPLGQLSACFVLPVPDTMEGIFEAVKNAALIHKSGGGTGFSFSRLRPKGSVVRSTGGVASGPVSFMKVFNAATEAVKQGGTRRGANMGILRVDHPDILEFIECKKDNKDITNFNISVGITEKFMEAVEKGEEYELVDPNTKKAIKKLNAQDVFNLIVESAWRNGEPGIIFLDRLNEDNVLPSVSQIESTNPCVVGDTWVLTENGPKQVIDILGKQATLALNGRFHPSTEAGFFKTGDKPVLRLNTDKGYKLEVTPDHKIRIAVSIGEDEIQEEWKSAGELEPGDKIILSNNRDLVWKGKGSFEEGYLLGLLIGNGTLKGDDGVISIWGEDEEFQYVIKAIEKAAFTLLHGKGLNEFKQVIGQKKDCQIQISDLKELATKYGIFPGNKKIPKDIEKTSYDFHRGFLKGIFDTNGSVIEDQQGAGFIRLSQKGAETLEIIQRMLIRMGVVSSLYVNCKTDDTKEIPEMKECTALSDCELVILLDDCFVFLEKVGFTNKKKCELLKQLLAVHKKEMNTENFIATVTEIVSVGQKDVYDVQIPGINAFDANGIYVHNCGEQPLLPYESCNLGSINLSTIVEEGENGYFINYAKLARIVDSAVHFLDNVIDMNEYPLKQIDEMTKNSRKIGLGVMGFADMLFKLGIPYNSEQAIELAEKVMKFIHDRSKKMSVELAEKRGAFPLFEESTLSGEEKSKLRNATTTTIAPTGTISIISGCSSGIEPLFAISFVRNVMDNDKLVEVHPYFEQVAKKRGFYSKELMEKIAEHGTIQGMEEIPEDVRRVFVTAHDVSPEYHIRMQAAFQKYTDNAVSKTVNFTHDATVEDVAEVYWLAYKNGCKGVTIYRDGSREGQVLSVKSSSTDKTESLTDKVKESMKSAKDKKQPQITPRPRPEVTMGITEKVKIGCGNLYITVNYDEHGICEVFTNLGRGGGCPSQSEATSRLVSMALRSGMDVNTLIEQLKGIRCLSTLRQKQKGIKVLSCPDAIGKVLEKVAKLKLNNNNGHDEINNLYLDEDNTSTIDTHICISNCSLCSVKDVCKKPSRENMGINLETQNKARNDHSRGEEKKNGFCPECGAVMEYSEGCIVCRSCGYSKCG